MSCPDLYPVWARLRLLDTFPTSGRFILLEKAAIKSCSILEPRTNFLTRSLGLLISRTSWVSHSLVKDLSAAAYSTSGHVAGLWHEHQRPDRDHYVRFNCEALPGYDAAKILVDQRGEDKMEDVCNDGTLAGTYGFSKLPNSTYLYIE